MITKNFSLSALVVALLFSPLAHAANLVNDFSVSVAGGFNWTEPSDPSRTDGITSNFTTSFSATTLVPGLVDNGFVTIDYTSPYPPGLFYSYFVDAFNSFNAGGPDFSLTGVTGFNISLRSEINNTASSINFYILGNNDNIYSWEIATSALSTSEFRVIPITLASSVDWVNNPTSGAWAIGVAASYSNPASTTYNISVDSVSSVPEPSTGALLASGLVAWGFMRRRNHS